MISSGWRRTWSRLAEMSWDELQARLTQEAGKRIDLGRYRLGLGFGTNGFRADETVRGKFFFSELELPGRTAILRERLPQAVDSILREADELCRHRFRLLGYTDLDYGAEIDWHLDAVSDRRAPLKPWFKIRYLDFDQVGDHKVIWELNRHQHLLTLAKAWRLTGERRYAGEIVSQWTSWQRANPYPLGINWASSLEVAFRSLSWLWLRELLADCDAMPPAHWKRLLRELTLHGRHIERFLSTYFSPNTHLIGEAVALFFIGTLCPQLSAARRWQELGWRILLTEAGLQVRADGVYFEHSLYYHVYALDFFLHARQLAAANGIGIPPAFDQTLIRMLGVLQALSQAGAVEGFGDDDGGRVFNPRRNRTGHMQDPLALGAATFGGFEARELTEEAVWLLGLEGVSGTQAGSVPGLRSKAFDAGGVYVLACDDIVPQRLTVDAGPHSAGRSGHGHADALSVRLTLGAQRWLIDSGTFTYRGDQDRDVFRGTAAHNSLRVDGKDQAVPAGPFAWSSMPSVDVDRWLQGVTFTLFTGAHNGYERLEDPVRHSRLVFHLHGASASSHGFWLVRDVAEGKQQHNLEIFWHFASDLTVTRDAGAFVIQAPGADETVAARMHLLPASTSNWTHELTSSLASPAYGVKEHAPVVRSSARVPLPAECATLLAVDTIATEGVCGRFQRLGADDKAELRDASAYCYTGAGGTHYFFFADAGTEWSFGPWASDAEVLYCHFKNHILAHVVLCSGSFLSLQGEAVVRLKRTAERFEYATHDATAETFSSDPSAVDSIAEKAMRFA